MSEAKRDPEIVEDEILGELIGILRDHLDRLAKFTKCKGGDHLFHRKLGAAIQGTIYLLNDLESETIA